NLGSGCPTSRNDLRLESTLGLPSVMPFVEPAKNSLPNTDFIGHIIRYKTFSRVVKFKIRPGIYRDKLRKG
ncbi:MAG: hypothetical protein ABSH41_30360, partial [Syntrophobacteraceae bacterium]